MVYVYVRYDEEEEPWHEHFVVAPVSGAGDDGRWSVYTADADLYVENLGAPPLRAIHWGGEQLALPLGLGRAFRQPVYRFREAVPAALKATLRRRAQRLQESAVAPPSAASARPVADSRIMLVGHPGSFLAVGTEVDPRLGDVQVGDFVLARRSEEVVVCQLVAADHRANFVQELRGRFSRAFLDMEGLDPGEAGEDVRTLPVKYERTGERFRAFEESVGLMSEEPFSEGDWPLEGPRSALWWMRATRRQGLSPISRHNRWVVDSGMPSADRSVREHEVLSHCIELASTVDQLNIASLLSFEHLIRRVQLIEEAHVLTPSYDGAEHWMGSGRRRRGLLVFPALAKHVATRVREETEVAKERSKAREQRRLAPTKMGGGGKGGGGGADGAT